MSATKYAWSVLGAPVWEPPIPKRGPRYGSDARCWLCGSDTHGVGWPRRTAVATIARRVGRTERAVVAYSYAHRCYPWDGSWYTPIEVARLLGVTRQCVTGWCARGVLRAQRVPGSRRWLIEPESVEALVRLRRPDVWQRWKERHDE